MNWKNNPDLLDEPRWLVLNKLDLLPKDEAVKRCRDIVKRLKWKQPVYQITAINGDGTKELVFDIMKHLEKNNEAAQAG